MSRIATIRGTLTLTIADADPVTIGDVLIPVLATTHSADNSVTLRLAPDLRQVRETVQAIFNQESEES